MMIEWLYLIEQATNDDPSRFNRKPSKSIIILNQIKAIWLNNTRINNRNLKFGKEILLIIIFLLFVITFVENNWY